MRGLLMSKITSHTFELNSPNSPPHAWGTRTMWRILTMVSFFMTPHRSRLIMLGLHRTPEALGTDLRPKMTKLVIARELVGKVVWSSYVTHQKVISYSWILTITRAHSPLKSTSSTIAFNRQKRSWNLSISLCQLPNSQLDPPLVASLRKLVVNHSVASYVILEIFISCKLLPSQTGNSRRSRPGGGSVVNRSQSIIGQS